MGLEIGIGDERVENLISIGTPVDKYDFGFLESCPKPILFVHGDRDEFGSVPRLELLVAKIKLHNPRVTVRLIKHAGHFFEGHLDELKHAIGDWLTPPSGPSAC